MNEHDRLVGLEAEVKFGFKELRADVGRVFDEVHKVNGTVASMLTWRLAHEQAQGHPALATAVSDQGTRLAELEKIKSMQDIQAKIRTADAAKLLGLLGYLVPVVFIVVQFL